LYADISARAEIIGQGNLARGGMDGSVSPVAVLGMG